MFSGNKHQLGFLYIENRELANVVIIGATDENNVDIMPTPRLQWT